MPLTDPAFRTRLQEILGRSGRSMRQLSAGLGRSCPWRRERQDDEAQHLQA